MVFNKMSQLIFH